MGKHSDDERDLVPRQPILSLSWSTPGHYRRFRLTPKPRVTDALLPDWGAKMPGVLHLNNGDLVVMGGHCQETHMHEVMKPTKNARECKGWRVNMTFRAFAPDSTPPRCTKRKRGEP